MLTEEQIKKYVTEGGVACPLCGSAEKLEAMAHEIITDQASVDLNLESLYEKKED